MKTVTVKSTHAVISDQCRQRPNDAAVHDALAVVEKGIRELYGYWPIGKGAKIHVKVEVEYPRNA